MTHRVVITASAKQNLRSAYRWAEVRDLPVRRAVRDWATSDDLNIQ